MAEEYFPSSDFLISVANEEAPIDGTVFGQANLKMLIAMTRDSDVSNRDWATMLLSQHGPMTDEVRDALLVAAEDEDLIVRAEAIEGLVARDRGKALALVRRELLGEVCIRAAPLRRNRACRPVPGAPFGAIHCPVG